MEFLIMGIVTFFDFAILKWKFEKRRYGDFALDLGMLLVVMTFFHSSTALLMVGMVAQFLMSFYLYFSPPKAFAGIYAKFDKRRSRPAL